MIIIEGPDGAGKSTLVQYIEDEYGLTREPRAVSSEAESIVPIGEWIEAQLRMGFGLRLYDRFALISSPHYAMLPNRTFVDPMFDMVWLRNMHHWFDRLDPVVIYCLPPMEVVKANVERMDNSGGKILPHIETIYILYHCYAARHYGTSCMVWDYTNPDYSRLHNLMSWARARMERERNARQVPTDAGDAASAATATHEGWGSKALDR